MTGSAAKLLLVNHQEHGGFAATKAGTQLEIVTFDPEPACEFTFWRPPHEFALTVGECEHLIKLAQEAGVNREDVTPRDTQPWRCTTWALTDEALGGDLKRRLALPGDVANALWWRLDIDSWHVQVKRYTVGQCHLEHTDLCAGSLDRKIAVSVQLSPPDSHRGGDLGLRWGRAWRVAPRDQGAVIAFPAWQLHQVTTVTSGERWALIVSGYGPPIR